MFGNRSNRKLKQFPTIYVLPNFSYISSSSNLHLALQQLETFEFLRCSIKFLSSRCEYELPLTSNGGIAESRRFAYVFFWAQREPAFWCQMIYARKCVDFAMRPAGNDKLRGAWNVCGRWVAYVKYVLLRLCRYEIQSINLGFKKCLNLKYPSMALRRCVFAEFLVCFITKYIKVLVVVRREFVRLQKRKRYFLTEWWSPRRCFSYPQTCKIIPCYKDAKDMYTIRCTQIYQPMKFGLR